VVGSLWIEKGLGMVVTGFVPNPLGHITEYLPTLPEALIALGIYAAGGLILAGLFKVAITVREELGVENAAGRVEVAAAREERRVA
jgi:molybdopterin-containing oxidoreductase family membrane subunit